MTDVATLASAWLDDPEPEAPVGEVVQPLQPTETADKCQVQPRPTATIIQFPQRRKD